MSLIRSKATLLWTKASGGALLFAMIACMAQADPIISKGGKVYTEKKCAACHSINGKGGKFGGDLTHVGAKRDAQWLTAFLKNPKTANPESKMSPFKGSDEELQDLVAYLLSLK
jgi:mono/diheme cytochrome c family protein